MSGLPPVLPVAIIDSPSVELTETPEASRGSPPEEERIQKLKKDFEYELNNVQLSTLQSKMNPHFTFNALNSIKVYLIENKKEMPVLFLTHPSFSLIPLKDSIFIFSFGTTKKGPFQKK